MWDKQCNKTEDVTWHIKDYTNIIVWVLDLWQNTRLQCIVINIVYQYSIKYLYFCIFLHPSFIRCGFRMDSLHGKPIIHYVWLPLYVFYVYLTHYNEKKFRIYKSCRNSHQCRQTKNIPDTRNRTLDAIIHDFQRRNFFYFTGIEKFDTKA